MREYVLICEFEVSEVMGVTGLFGQFSHQPDINVFTCHGIVSEQGSQPLLSFVSLYLLLLSTLYLSALSLLFDVLAKYQERMDFTWNSKLYELRLAL
jgi:hypothetical protein